MTYQGVEYRGLHEALVDEDTFARVQAIFAARDGRSLRDRRHRHYLKGIVFCGVCGRAPSLQLSKGRYRYFYCLGQKDRHYPTGCRENYVSWTGWRPPSRRSTRRSSCPWPGPIAFARF